MRKFTSFETFNEYVGIKKPLNSHIDLGAYQNTTLLNSEGIFIDFYRISFKTNYVNPEAPDYNPRSPNPITAVFFNSPGKVYKWDLPEKFEGYYLQLSKELIESHRFLFQSYLDYGQHEALFLTKEEEEEIIQLYSYLINKYHNRPEDTNVLIAYANLILNLVETFYQRQFHTEVEKYNYIVREFQQLLNDYYSQGFVDMPMVHYFADRMQLSSNYLGDVIKAHTQRTAIETIHHFVAKRAEKLLIETNLSNSEIAFQLGFTYPNYFSKFFKKHTQLTPRQYREKQKVNSRK